MIKGPEELHSRLCCETLPILDVVALVQDHASKVKTYAVSCQDIPLELAKGVAKRNAAISVAKCNAQSD